jgi:hypothetical protein
LLPRSDCIFAGNNASHSTALAAYKAATVTASTVVCSGNNASNNGAVMLVADNAQVMLWVVLYGACKIYVASFD